MQQSPLASAITCPVCKSDLMVVTDPESGEDICKKCGMIVSEKVLGIINKSELSYTPGAAGINYRYSSRNGNRTSLARHDMGLSTVIGKTNRDASGKIIDAAMHTTMQRLRTWDSRAYVRTYSDRSLIHAMNELDMLKDKLALPDAVVETAAYIYRKAHNKRLTRGRTISGLVAASAYVACREMDTPRTLKDIAIASNINRKRIAKGCRLLVSQLDIKVPLVDQIKCIVKVANNANLSEKTKRRAINIMAKAAENEISAGKNPMGLAATVLYISCIKTGESISQKEISNVAGITEVTLRNRVKELISKPELLEVKI
jgi:transcription initiation factor TFIIB